jgi:tRNA threonylcarbamoyladenosine biosynthesis protein TsaB
MELSIDTSTRYASVGLSRQGETIIEMTWRSERNHSVELVPAIRDIMARAGVEMNDLKAIFNAKGPGGFSALRVGMSTAKAMATALNIPLVSVGTLDVEAGPFRGLVYPVVALVGAGRNRLYVGRYASGADESAPDYSVSSCDEFTKSIDSTTLFCGEAVLEVADLLRERLGEKALIACQPPPARSVGVMSRLAYGKLKAGETDDPSTLQPLYLRSSQVNAANKRWAESR